VSNTEHFLQDIHTQAPVDTKYVMGRWHRDRVAFGGIFVEGKVLLKSLTVPAQPMRKFLVIGRARSGTTLLTRMLNGHGQIFCDGEICKRRVIAPLPHFHCMARKSRSDVYGAKLLSYQMVQVHRIYDPRVFAKRLIEQGILPVHIERDSFAQTLSLAVAQRRKFYHSDKSGQKALKKIRLDPDDFVARLAWSEDLLRYERVLFSAVDHLAVNYEKDLMTAEDQQATLDRMCTAVGVGTEPARIPLKKLLSTNPYDIIENCDEVFEALKRAGFERLLPSV
jgi:LPS sulfotransferase NodH